MTQPHPRYNHTPIMNRRRFIRLVSTSLLAGPLAAEAQQTGKMYRVGMLETRSSALNTANVDAFRQGLRGLGYREGVNLEIAYRSSDGRDDRFSHLVSELI